MTGGFTHFDEQGAPQMVDVGDKPITRRWACASGFVRLAPDALAMVAQGQIAKGDVLQVARLAGITAAKRTSEWIPLAHPLAIDAITMRLSICEPDGVRIESVVKNTAKTGVEMEALTAVSAAALTIYDMCKSLDRSISIESIQLTEKGGGRSGVYKRAASAKPSDTE